MQYDSFNLATDIPEILLVWDFKELAPRLWSVQSMTGSFVINKWFSNFILCYLKFFILCYLEFTESLELL